MDRDGCSRKGSGESAEWPQKCHHRTRKENEMQRVSPSRMIAYGSGLNKLVAVSGK